MNNSSAQHPVSLVARVLRSKTLLGIAALILLYTLGGFFLTPYLVKRQLTQFAQDDLQRQLAIDQVRFNPYTLRIAMDGLDLREGNGEPLLGFRQRVVDFDLSRLWERAWTFAEISLEEPKLNLAIDAQGEMNVQRLVDDLPTNPEPTPAMQAAPPPRLLLRRLHIRRAPSTSSTTPSRRQPRRPSHQSIWRCTTSPRFRSAKAPSIVRPSARWWQPGVAWRGVPVPGAFLWHQPRQGDEACQRLALFPRPVEHRGARRLSRPGNGLPIRAGARRCAVDPSGP